MPETIICPECGNKVAKGSTHCLHCGTRLDTESLETGPAPAASTTTSTAEAHLESLESRMTEMLSDEPVVSSASEDSGADDLPPIDDDLLTEPETGGTEMHETEEIRVPGERTESRESEGALEWEVEESLEGGVPTPEGAETIREIDPSAVREVEATVEWEIDSDEVVEGDPFKEIEPPVPKVMEPVHAREMDPALAEELEPITEFASAPEDAKTHLFTDKDTSRTAKAVTHLFPEGKGTTSKEFIDIVVGKPKRIVIEEPMPELETPTCPSCGTIITSDGFTYPSYVYSTMARARMEQGNDLLKRGDHEKAIEAYERAKLLYEKAGDKKGVEEATGKVDEGYESMAESHYLEAEQHLKQDEFEWAIVQFRKARELYMFTSLVKMRAKCSERIQRTYEEWGKSLEAEGDRLSKRGDSRRALTLYQEAAEKYRLADAKKKLKGLEKKILRA